MGDDIKAINNDKIISWDDFIAKGLDVSDDDILDRMNNIDLDNTSSIIYTSGTTGNPKGVELHIIILNRNSVGDVLKFDQGDRYVSWLPLAHVFGQLVDNHYWVKRALHMSVLIVLLIQLIMLKKFSLIFLLVFLEYMKRFILI